MKIIYFTRGQISTKEAVEIVKQFGGNVAFRDAKKVDQNAPLEECDAVAGDVPANYLNSDRVEIPDKIEAFELPKISDGAYKLAKELEISDEELSLITPTGKHGIVQVDVKRYLAEKG